MEDYNDLKQIYKETDSYCKKRLGKVYIGEKLELIDLPCNKWTCPECRPRLKNQLHEDIVRNVYNFDLQKHLVITCQGKEFRKKYSYEESFWYMNEKWDNFRKFLNYHYPDMMYILLPRAQKDGYCHYHILTNKWMDWNLLNKVRKRYGLGYMSIQKNKDVAEYLAKDYFKENEWIIPPNIRHFRSSKGIYLMNYGSNYNSYNKIFFKTNISDNEIINGIYERFCIKDDLSDYYIKKHIAKKIKENRDEIEEYIEKQEIRNGYFKLKNFRNEDKLPIIHSEEEFIKYLDKVVKDSIEADKEWEKIDTEIRNEIISEMENS